MLWGMTILRGRFTVGALRYTTLLWLATFLSLTHLSSGQPGGLRLQLATEGLHVGTLPHPGDPSRTVEYFWTKPAGNGPFPLLVMVHGHQNPSADGTTDGGRALWRREIMQPISELGVVVVSVSQPSYGKSSGPSDWCGPDAQNAVEAVYNSVMSWGFVDRQRTGLYGISRGAVVVANVAARHASLRALIVHSGSYDLRYAYDWIPDHGDENAIRMRANMAAQMPLTKEGFDARSASKRAADIHAATLVLHGDSDRTFSYEDAQHFAMLLADNTRKTRDFPWATAWRCERPRIARSAALHS